MYSYVLAVYCKMGKVTYMKRHSINDAKKEQFGRLPVNNSLACS